MPRPDVVIFHEAPRPDSPPLTRLLATARTILVEDQSALFRDAGARRVLVVARNAGRDRPAPSEERFGARLARLVREERMERAVVLGAGAVPRLGARDARLLVDAASSSGRVALTNNRYSSDVCAVSDATVLRDLPPLPADNALPRWLEEHRGFRVNELRARERLALDLDSPLDLAILALARTRPARVAELASRSSVAIPRLDDLRALVSDRRGELLVFGRAGAATLRWLETNARCRVRFLSEERGLRASSPLAVAPGGSDPAPAAAVDRSRPSGDAPSSASRRPRAALGRLLDARGAGSLAAVVSELADGGIVDTRVLMADRFGRDESAWPDPEDRFASDLHRHADIRDPWLRELTASAAASGQPILLGAHTLVGPGIPLVCR